jgi:hypothetical protein
MPARWRCSPEERALDQVPRAPPSSMAAGAFFHVGWRGGGAPARPAATRRRVSATARDVPRPSARDTIGRAGNRSRVLLGSNRSVTTVSGGTTARDARVHSAPCGASIRTLLRREERAVRDHCPRRSSGCSDGPRRDRQRPGGVR